MTNKEKNLIKSRRKFLKNASCASIGGLTFMNSFLNLNALNAAAISNSSINCSGYKAMVCLFQAGGNDSFNMLLPTNPTQHAEYSNTRGNLAVALGDILPLNNTNYGVLDTMTGVQSLFNQNKLSFISNIGTLTDYITKAQYFSPGASRPLGLFSHSDQEQQWHTSILDQRTAVGWGGKIADLLNDCNTNQNISMNVSLSINGTNTFQTGNNTIEYVIGPNGAVGIDGYDPNPTWLFETVRRNAIDNMLAHTYQDVFKQTYINTLKDSRDAYLEFTNAINSFQGFSPAITFMDTDLSNNLEMVAKTISIQSTLGFQRQIFFVDVGGWDHHDGLDDHPDMMGDISDALFEFNAALEDIGFADDVVTFSISEFGRTLSSNGNGSDHGWGGNVMVMGGPNTLNGGQIFGSYPSMVLDSSLEIGGGVYIPTTSTDSYFAELAKWFGVPDSDLGFIFPQLSNFWSAGSATPPIGFLNI